MTTSQIFILFLRNGLQMLANSYATLERALTEEENVLTKEEFVRTVTLSQAFPGIFSLNMAAFIGKRLKGYAGIFAALAGAIIPALTIFIFIAFLSTMGDAPEWIRHFLRGLRPAAVALLVPPCYKLGRDVGIHLSTVVIPIAAAILIVILHISPAYIVIATALCGYVYGRLVRPVEK